MKQKTSVAPERLESLSAERSRWLDFLCRRVSSKAEAEDILQDCLLRAIEGVENVRREEDLFAWFYRILRHAVVDDYRRKQAAGRRDERFAAELAVALEADRRVEQSRRTLCACVRPRLAHLNSRYARILEAVDFDGMAPAEVAVQEQTTLNTINVTLHRARQALRRELLRFCGACAEEACLDCNCDPVSPANFETEKK